MKYQLITIKLGKLEDWQEEEKKKKNNKVTNTIVSQWWDIKMWMIDNKII